MKKTASIVWAIIVLAMALSASVQEAKPEMNKELVKLNYVRANDIMMLLRPFSGPEGRITSSSDGFIITISDTRENIARLLVAIKEIDVKPADVQFTVQLVLASEDGVEKTDEALANDPVIKELKSFLKYRSFSLLDTSMVRAVDTARSELTMGPHAEFALRLRPKVIKNDKANSIQVEVELDHNQGYLGATTEKPTRMSQTLIQSNLTVKSGEKTVVGVSRTAGGEKGLILIISAKVI